MRTRLSRVAHAGDFINCGSRQPVAIAILCATLGCSSSGNGAGGGGGGGLSELEGEASAFIEAYAQEWCNDLEPCCKKYVPFNKDACLKAGRDYGAIRVVLPTGPSTQLPHYNPTSQATCLQEIHDVAAACLAGDSMPSAPADQCERVFTPGSKGLGETCSSGRECAPPADGDSACTDGVCAAESRNLPDGAACASIDGACASGLICDRNNVVCEPRFLAGERCSYNSDCAEGLRCLGTSCAPLGGDGASCNLDWDCTSATYCLSSICRTRLAEGSACTSGSCASSDYCSEATHVCTPRVAFGKPCPYSPTSTESPCVEEGGCLPLMGDLKSLICLPKNIPSFCLAH